MTTLAATPSQKIDSTSLAKYVRIEDEWLVFDQPHLPPQPGHYLPVLRANSELSGCARYCLSPGDELRFRADIPQIYFQAGDEYDTTVVQSDDIHLDPVSLLLECMLVNDAQAEVGSDDIADLCTRTGWPFTLRQDGTAAVDLDLRTGAASAVVSPGRSGVDVTVNLLTIGAADEVGTECREAIAVFLLRVCGAVRMVSAEFGLHGDREVFSLAVHVPPGHVGLHVPHAFAALSVAVAVSRAECRALLDRGIARAFLMTRESIDQNRKEK